MFYTPGPTPTPQVHTAADRDTQARAQIRELEHEVQRLCLINQALWEVVRDRLNLTDPELEAKMREVDLRDGVADGRVSEVPLECPTCGRVSNSKHWRCLYCGQEFQKPVIG